MARWHDQVVLITGASSGIGRALAVEFACHGARLGLLARRTALLEELRTELEKDGIHVAIATADVADQQATHDAIAGLREQLGPIDLLIANAGIGGETHIRPFNYTTQHQVLQINLLGMIHAIEAVLPDMLARRSGHLAAVSSIAAYHGLPGQSAYAASKAAMNAYLEGLRVQLRPHQIAVTTICPGFVKTPIIDKLGDRWLPFLLTPEQAARRIRRGLERRAKMLHVPWVMRLVIGATHWLPDWLVEYALRDIIPNPPDATEKAPPIA